MTMLFPEEAAANKNLERNVLHESVQKLPGELTEKSSAYGTVQNDNYYQ
jgi:hypothetical protein